MAMSGMKQRLRAGEVLGGYVNIIPSAVAVQALGRLEKPWSRRGLI